MGLPSSQAFDVATTDLDPDLETFEPLLIRYAEVLKELRIQQLLLPALNHGIRRGDP